MDESARTITILIVGSLPPPLGGCSVTLEQLVDELGTRPEVALRVIDTRGIRGQRLRGAGRLLGVLFELARIAPTVDVVTLHVATSALPHWGLVVLGVARLARRPFVLRKFAGTDYRRLGPLRGRLAHVVASCADVYLVETREHLARSYQRGLAHAHWFPTARPLPAKKGQPGGGDGACRRFVYVGHLRKEKGLVELVDAMRGMPPEVTLDVFGPRFDDLPSNLFGQAGVTVHGPLAPRDVVPTLSRYDAFVLPTLASTEGYPGTVLEAYCAGLPVIASRIGGIPEIVDSGVGFLVEPGDVTDLRESMSRLVSDAATFKLLRSNARNRADAFSTHRWADEFLSHCRAVVSTRG